MTKKGNFEVKLKNGPHGAGLSLLSDFSKNYGTLIYLIILIENFICKPVLLVFFSII